MTEVSLRNFWFEGKRWFEDAIGLTGSEAHLHIGLAIFVVGLMLFGRRRYGVFWAWTMVFVIQSLNELLDARDWINWTGHVNWPETLRDFGATLLWPTVLGMVLWNWPRRSA